MLRFLPLLVLLVGCSTVRLDVRSDPPNARVLVDGTERGVTPASLNFVRGEEYEIAVTARGYETWRTTFPAANNTTLTAVLEPARVVPSAPPPPPQPVGSVTRVSVFVVPGGDVWVDGQSLGMATEADAASVVYRDDPTASGLVVKARGYKDWSRTVALEAGRDNRFFIHLEPVSAWHSYPSDAEMLRRAVEQIVGATANIPTLRRTSNIAVLSIDHPEGSDRPMQALLQDAFITTLAQAGFTPAERDDDMLVQLAHSNVGDSLPFRITTANKNPGEPFVYNAEIATTRAEPVTHSRPYSTTHRVTTTLANGARMETETVQQETLLMESVARTEPLIGYVPTSDQFLAYRILEVGIAKSPVTEGEARSEPMLHRRAELRVHVRVIDAPTGRITWAGFLTGNVGDEIPARVSLDLANPPVRFYSAPIPESNQEIRNPMNMNGTSSAPRPR